jgi:nucleotide-binding universal stress UspA family protein
MSIVLAALDATHTAQSVLEAALRVGEMTDSGVEAVHAPTGHNQSLTLPTDHADVPLHLLSGPREPAVLSAIDAPDVLAAVIGAKAAADDPRLLGTTARYIVERSSKPVVIVPPKVVAPGAFRRLLIPLEGTESSSRPVLERLLPLLATDVELIVLHVFTEATQPTMLDHPSRDLEMMGREFLTRHLPRQEARIELRPGPVGIRVAEVCDEHGADLIVLSWSQDSRAGRARVVREVLGGANLPILLLPLRAERVGRDLSS